MKNVLSMIGCLAFLFLLSTVNGQKYARCKLRPNRNAQANLGNQYLKGTIWFKEENGVTTIAGKVTGFTTPDNSKHGFHIHAHAEGAEDNDCNAAGAHFNPKEKTHGAPNATVRHYGDLGNLIVQNGMATVGDENQNSFVTLEGPYKVVERSIVVHAGEDDLGLGGDAGSLATGNAGGRLACCVIEEYEYVVYTATCTLQKNTNSQNTDSQDLSGSVITLTQDMTKVDEEDRRTEVTGRVKGFDGTDDVKMHGFHIHKESDPQNNCNNNEGHYNPDGTNHGGPFAYQNHFGDLGNIEDESNGIADVSIYGDYVELFGTYTVEGRSIVVHALEDDLGKGTGAAQEESLKTGNAGARLACCKIGVATTSEPPSSKATNKKSFLSLTVIFAMLTLFRLIQ